MITIVGLGVTADDLTAAGRTAILAARKVLVRTELAASAASLKALDVAYTALDGIYETSRNFETLNRNLAKAVLNEAKEGDVVYCVDGSPAEDNSAKLICQKRKDVAIVGGVSKVSAVLAAARLSSCNVTAVSAYELTGYRRASLPLVVYDIDSQFLAGDVKLALSDLIGEERKVLFVHHGEAKSIFLYELDRQPKYDYTSALVIETIPLLEKDRFDYADLEEIIRLLRAPGGCPWDRVQTNESIRMNLIEEAYELVDAIDLQDDDKMREETGDVLLQACFHAVIKEEQGAFNSTDVITELCKKLIFRHSHVFGEEKAKNAAEALASWDKNKGVEKGQKTCSDAVKDVPKCFPALLRAQKVGKRAAKSGFDFETVEDCLLKTEEELSEFLEAYQYGAEAQRQDELGDVLFSVVNMGRKAGIDCELALKESVQKFVDRFCAMEKLLLAEGKTPQSLSAEEFGVYWNRVKHADKAD